MRSRGDPIADQAWQIFDIYNHLACFRSKLLKIDDLLEYYVNNKLKNESDLSCNDSHEQFLSNPHINALFIHSLKEPDWLDWRLISSGHDVFAKYSAAAMLGFLFYSLIGGFMVPKIVEVLYRSSDLTKSADATWRRLNLTLEFVLDCTSSRDAMRIGQIGWIAAIKTRLIHASVRHYLLNNAAKPWNNDEFDYPINQEDLSSVLLAFSLNIIHVMQYFKAPLTENDIHSYLHLWRYIGYLLGIDVECNPCSSYERATHDLTAYLRRTAATINTSEVKDSPSGILARHVLKSSFNKGIVKRSYLFNSELARALLGREHADNLGLEVSYYHRVLVWLFISFMRVITAYIAPYRAHDGPHIRAMKGRYRRFVNSNLGRK